MPARRLLYLTAHQLVAYQWTGGHLREEAAFQPSETASDFIAYLQKHRSTIFSLAVNVAEEGFQVDTIPFLQAKDRATVVERKLGQMLQGAALTVAVSLGFEKTRRRDERLLFAALNNNTLFAPWLAAIKAGEARLAGIFSLPLLAASVAARMQLPKVRSLLVTVQDTSIRQSFFDRGQLCFSRMSPLANSSIAGISQAVANEAAKTQQYLLSQRQLARTDALAVHVLVHPQAMSAVSAACTGTDTLVYEVHDLHAVARKLGLKTLPEDSRAEFLYLHAAAVSPPRTQFAKDAMRHQFQLWQFANGLRTAGAVAFAGCALFVAKELVSVLSIRNETELATSAAAIADQRYQSLTRTFPNIAVGNDTLRQITAKYGEFSGVTASPVSLYGEISRALEAAPPIEITAIDWQFNGIPGGGIVTAPAAPVSPVPTPGVVATTGERSESAVIRGTIEMGADAKPRELLKIFDAFLDQLRATPGSTVSVQEQPFDIGAEKSLKSTEGGTAISAPRPFTVTISRKVKA